jgi:putative transposase
MYHNRQTIRLSDYDYSQSGYYFLTICTKERLPILGEIKNERMILNNSGFVAWDVIKSLHIRFALNVDTYQIMPNHIHFIVHLVGAHHDAPQNESSTKRSIISQCIGYLKMNISKQLGFSVFQRNYYERVIRKEQEFGAIKKYIQDNPKNWQDDLENIRK